MDDDKAVMPGVLWGAKAIADYIGQTPRQTYYLLESGKTAGSASRSTMGDHQGKDTRSPQRADTAMSGIFWPLVHQDTEAASGATDDPRGWLFDIVNFVLAELLYSIAR